MPASLTALISFNGLCSFTKNNPWTGFISTHLDTGWRFNTVNKYLQLDPLNELYKFNLHHSINLELIWMGVKLAVWHEHNGNRSTYNFCYCRPAPDDCSFISIVELLVFRRLLQLIQITKSTKPSSSEYHGRSCKMVHNKQCHLLTLWTDVKNSL